MIVGLRKKGICNFTKRINGYAQDCLIVFSNKPKSSIFISHCSMDIYLIRHNTDRIFLRTVKPLNILIKNRYMTNRILAIFFSVLATNPLIGQSTGINSGSQVNYWEDMKQHSRDSINCKTLYFTSGKKKSEICYQGTLLHGEYKTYNRLAILKFIENTEFIAISIRMVKFKRK